jgi:hypothetical protein
MVTDGRNRESARTPEQADLPDYIDDSWSPARKAMRPLRRLRTAVNVQVLIANYAGQ